MSTRERLTWSGITAAGPVLPAERARLAAEAKKAAEHPQLPDEGITHPAGYPDPGANDYKNGDTSSWAEDVSTAPVRTSPQPANPMDDGGYRHPAAQAGAPAKNASHDLRASAERKAAKCIRLASALLGEQVTKAAEAEDKVAVDLIEAQALDFMDLSDNRLASTLRRIEAATADPEVLLRKMLAEEAGEPEEEDEKDEKEEPSKEASGKTAEEAKFAEVTSMLANVMAELQAMKSGGWGAKAEAPAEDKDDALLAEMLEEEGKKAEAPAEDEAEAMLQAMLAEEAPAPATPPAAEGKTLADYMDDPMDDFSMDVMDDPMGDLGAPDEFGDDAILSSLFASDAVKLAEEEEEEKDEPEEKDEDEAAEEVKKAAVAAKLRPQPKLASTGARTIGNQTRVASNVGDVSDLAKLWETSPDISSVFGK